jgi:glycerol-3-phosphate O-acyltransferase
MSNGQITSNLQRETEYTKILSDKIVNRYFQENVVLSSHLIAFVVFKILEQHYEKLDIYGILRLDADDHIFPYESIKNAVSDLQKILFAWEAEGKIKLSEQIHWQVDDLVKHGASEMGIYHISKPIEVKENGNVASGNFSLLFFYHNRLMNYGLEKKVKWEKYKMEVKV